MVDESNEGDLAHSCLPGFKHGSKQGDGSLHSMDNLIMGTNRHRALGRQKVL